MFRPIWCTLHVDGPEVSEGSPFLEVATRATNPELKSDRPTAVKAPASATLGHVPVHTVARPLNHVSPYAKALALPPPPPPLPKAVGPGTPRECAGLKRPVPPIENTELKMARLMAPTPSQAPAPGVRRDVSRSLEGEMDAVSESKALVEPDSSLVFPENLKNAGDHQFTCWTPSLAPTAPATPAEEDEPRLQ